MNEISIKTLSNLASLNLIDIRRNYLYVRGSLKGAINISYPILREYPEKYLLKDEVYYLFCESGIESKKLADYLTRLGFNVFSIKEGYQEMKY